jgi:hypothetical protein
MARSWLHDAVLLTVTAVWSSQELIVEYRDHTGAKSLKLSGLRSLTYSAEFPWGQSVSINSVTSNIVGENSVHSIQMQSGDVIVVTVSGHADIAETAA